MSFIGRRRYSTSDCDADNDVFSAHHYLHHTAAQAVADILHAGTDVDCGFFILTVFSILTEIHIQKQPLLPDFRAGVVISSGKHKKK